jgi:hypothetical protein
MMGKYTDSSDGYLKSILKMDRNALISWRRERLRVDEICEELTTRIFEIREELNKRGIE